MFVGTFCLLSGEEQTQILSDFRTYAENAMHEWSVPGMSIAIVKDGKVIFAEGFGVTEHKGSEKVTPETLFQIGSISKSFTTALMGILIDEGLFKWEDKVIDHLPSFMMFDPWVTREFEIQDLFSQRSGLPSYAGDASATWIDSPESFVHALRYIEPVSSFRSKFAYQNIFFNVAALAMKAKVGKTWHTLIKERIFVPLGMTSSSSNSSDFKATRNVAKLHERLLDNSVRPLGLDFPYMDWVYTLGPAGGINSTILDMAKYLTMQIQSGTYAENKQLIKKETIERMHRPYIFAYAGNTGSAYYGLGWIFNTYSPYPIIWHNGGSMGAASMLGFIPQEKLGIVILTNLKGSQLADALNWQFFDMYYKRPNQDWSHVFLEKTKKDAEVALKEMNATPTGIVTPALPLKSYEGTYHNNIFGEAIVSIENSHLLITMGKGKARMPLTHWDSNIFNMAWPEYGGDAKSKVNFSLSPDTGQPNAFEIVGFLGSFKRV